MKKKSLTRNEIIDRIAEQIILVITRVCKESMSSSELLSVSFTYLFKFTNFCFIDVWTFYLRKLETLHSH